MREILLELFALWRRSVFFTASAVIAILAPLTAHGQSPLPPAAPIVLEINIGRGRALSSHGTDGTVQVAPADAATLAIIRSITDVVGLAVGFEVRAAPVPEAVAVEHAGKSYLLYNPSFIERVEQRAPTYWSRVSVLAHEIGHILGFHRSDDGKAHQDELEADHFTGYVLARLGAPLNEATAALREIAMTKPTATHPVLVERIAAITYGWRSAMKDRPSGRPTTPPPATQTAVVTAPIVKWSFTYFEGEGYAKYAVGAFEACERHCAQDARCVALEFDRRAGICNVYERAPVSGTSGEHDIGFKQLLGEPTFPAAPPAPSATASVDATAQTRPVPVTSTLWDHNGSIMALTIDGSKYSFVYAEPKEGMRQMGVTRGTLLFEGVRDASRLRGLSRIFRGAHCGNFQYSVEGVIAADERTMTLYGDRSDVDTDCRILRRRSDTLVFTQRP